MLAFSRLRSYIVCLCVLSLLLFFCIVCFYVFGLEPYSLSIINYYYSMMVLAWKSWGQLKLGRRMSCNNMVLASKWYSHYNTVYIVTYWLLVKAWWLAVLALSRVRHESIYGNNRLQFRTRIVCSVWRFTDVWSVEPARPLNQLA